MGFLRDFLRGSLPSQTDSARIAPEKSVPKEEFASNNLPPAPPPPPSPPPPLAPLPTPLDVSGSPLAKEIQAEGSPLERLKLEANRHAGRAAVGVALGCLGGPCIWVGVTVIAAFLSLAIFGGGTPRFQPFVDAGSAIGFLAGLVFTVLVIVSSGKKKRWLDAEVKRLTVEAEERRRNEEVQRTVAAAFAARLIELRHLIDTLCGNGMLLAENLPNLLQRAEQSLNRSEEEFAEGVFALFWDAIEASAQNLVAFDQDVRQITRIRGEYREAVMELQLIPKSAEMEKTSGDAVPDLRLDVLPEAKHTFERMRAIVRAALKEPNFAKIYEMRQHNKLLDEGFSTLGNALANLGSSIEASVRELESSLADNISELTSEQRRASAEALTESRVMRAQIERGTKEAAKHAHVEAKTRKEHERKQQELMERIAERTKRK